MDQVDPADQASRTSVTDRMAESDGRSNVPESGSQVATQFHPLERGMLSDVELRFKHNAALPVHTLPAELFLQVIHCVMRPSLEENKTGNYRHLISLSGVCSHWCSVIRDSPPLWTQLHLWDSPNIVKMAIQRSSCHLLDITINKSSYLRRAYEDMQEFLNTIILHRNRWRTLGVSLRSSLIPLVTAALEEPALNLEKLSLIDQDTVSSTLQVDFFRGAAPQLKDLTLNGVSIRWDSEVVHGLKFVDLSWIHFPSTKAILDILSRSPQLQQATIWKCTTGSIFTDSSYSIRLSRLSFLRIDLGRLEAIDNILGSIKALSERSSLTIPSLPGENVDGFLQRLVAGWTSNWNVAAMFGELRLDIDANELRIGIDDPDYPEPLTLAVDGFRAEGTEFLSALSSLVDTLASWSKDSATLLLKLGKTPSTYYTVPIKRPFVHEISRLPITSLEILGFGDGSLIDILISEGAYSVFQNVCTLSFSGMLASDLSNKLEWFSNTIRFIKTATESSLNELGRRPKLWKVELRVSFSSEEADIMEANAKELEGIVRPGRIFVVNTNQK
ncbi:hypothetical protein M407DRAFT_27935 [Tulasnella calospora MUT 4182]|uniref:Uncharacterized protein n=1 Tax=Tulasnella calospora MUT 4182 TaxID=1051891 RepID=A0A0C3Q2A0_9AGAM|nr:hypothetical protein M407DRAFT_27935 [Tulasnella calospora MUT 4182]